MFIFSNQRLRLALGCVIGCLVLGALPVISHATPTSQPKTTKTLKAKPIAKHTAPAQINGWVEGNLKTALSLAKGKKAILMQVHAHWCSPCNQLTYEVIDTPAGRKMLTQAVGVRVNFETPAGREVTRRYGVLGLPTTLVLTAKGEEIGRVLGYGGSSSYISAIQDALAGKNGFKAVEAQYKKDPKNHKNQLTYAQALLHKGKEAQAKKLLFGLMVKGNPLASSAFRIWGRWLVRVKHDGVNGAKHFLRGAAFFRGTRQENGYRYWAAKGYQVAGQSAKAMALFDEQIKKQPNNIWAKFSKVGFMIHYKYPVKEIEKVLPLLLKKMPQNTWLLYLSAQVKLRKKDKKGALKDIEEAVKRNPHSAIYKYFAQRVRQGKGH